MANVNGGKGEPAIGFQRLGTKVKDPQLQALLSKLVAGDENSRRMGQSRENKSINAPDMTLLQRISEVTTNNVTDSDSILQLLPDLEMAMQILVSTILSPKDMVNTELNYSVDKAIFNSEISGELLQVVKTYFESTYKLADLSPEILRQMLFLSGSYPLLVLPETTIDHAINSRSRVSVESISDVIDPKTHSLHHVGILGNGLSDVGGPTTKANVGSLEGYFSPSTHSSTGYSSKVSLLGTTFNPLLDVVDNPNVLKLPMLKSKLRQEKLQDVLAVRKISMESRKSGDREKETSLYPRRHFRSVPIVTLHPDDTRGASNIGHPLVMVLPAESVIPVHVPSDPSSHLGYFVLLDAHGNPIIKANAADYYTNLSSNLNSNKDMVSQLVASAKHYEQGLNNANSVRQNEINEIDRVYTGIMSKELEARLRNGIYGEDVEVARPVEVYRIMLARALAKMQTQVLYVPTEMLTYFAFDYNKYGVGTSLIAKTKIVGGIRSMLLFANTMASIKNSVGRTQLNITLDPQDPDPSTTVEFMMHEYVKTRQGTYPLGASNPMDIISFLQNAGVEVAVSGNSAYPETKLEVEDKQSNRAKPDPELEKAMRDKHLQAIGVPPEKVDASTGPEFATTVTSNDLMFSKRVVTYQRTFVGFLEDFCRMYVRHSGILMDELTEIVKTNRSKLSEEHKKRLEKQAGRKSSIEHKEMSFDSIVSDFLAALRITLPAPDVSVLDNQMKAFDDYVVALDKGIEAYLDSDFLEGSEMGELQEAVAPAIAAVRAHYIRQWLRDNNVLPELDALTTFSDEDGPAVDLLNTHTNHVTGISKSLAAYMKSILAARAKTDKTVTDAKADLDATTNPPPAANEAEDAASDDAAADGADAGGDGDMDVGELELPEELDGEGGEGTSADETPDAAAGDTSTQKEEPETDKAPSNEKDLKSENT